MNSSDLTWNWPIVCVCVWCLSLVNIYRSIKGILGFSRETLPALITDTEGRESRWRECVTLGYPPEHPWSSTTDDVFLVWWGMLLGRMLRLRRCNKAFERCVPNSRGESILIIKPCPNWHTSTYRHWWLARCKCCYLLFLGACLRFRFGLLEGSLKQGKGPSWNQVWLEVW